MFVSVVVPVYNAAVYLDRSINSLIKQTHRNLEIVLVDDGSTDESGQICDDFALQDDRIRVFHTENKGQSAARNYGVQKATSDWIVFLDADDYYELFAIEYLAKIKQKHSADLVVSNLVLSTEIEYHFADGAVERSRLFEKGELLRCVYYGQYSGIHPCAKLYSKNVLLKNPYPEGHTHEDFDTTYKLIAGSNRIAVGDLVTYHQMVRAGSVTQVAFHKGMLYYFEAAQHNIDFVVKTFPDRPEVYKAAAFAYVVAGLSVVYKMIQAGLLSEVKAYQVEFRKYFKCIFLNKNIKIRRKLGYYIFIISVKLYAAIKGFI